MAATRMTEPRAGELGPTGRPYTPFPDPGPLVVHGPARIIAVCSTYDAMTKRETFGPPMDGEEAIAELRTIAGSQLDAALVDAFVALLERNGREFGRDADYKTELEFDKRVRKLAQPHTSDGATFARAPTAMRLRRRA